MARERTVGYMRRWRHANPERAKAILDRSRAKSKREAFDAYGGPVCVCCGESHIDLLTLDHIGGIGTKLEMRIRTSAGRIYRRGGHFLYARLRREGYPPGYRVLCFNCNFGEWLPGGCPHKRNIGAVSTGAELTEAHAWQG